MPIDPIIRNSKMNYHDAIDILQISEDVDKPLTVNIIKKKYRMAALMYHPDKNKSDDAGEKFFEVQDAYEFLMEHINVDMKMNSENSSYSPNMNSYKGLLAAFLRNIMDDGCGDPVQDILFIVVQKLTQLCETKAFEFIEKLNKDLLMKIYDILYRYYKVLSISEDFVLKLRKVLDEKLQNDSCIILNPTLEDLLEDKAYRLVVDEKTYWIPLWHHELVYDVSGADLYVRCFPILPDNVSINENNDIIIKSRYSIHKLLYEKELTFHLAGKEYKKQPELVFVRKTQNLLISNYGIAHMNTDDIFNVTKRGQIFAEIELY
jgi:hypothetical protein